MPGETETEIDTMAADFERWLTRYGVPNAYARWKQADKAQAPLLAMIAIACEARILMQLNLDHASRLVHDAMIVLAQIEAAPVTPATSAAAEIVGDRIGKWQQYMRSLSGRHKHDRKPPSASDDDDAESGTLNARNAAADVLKDFPQFRASSASFLFNTVGTLGARGLHRLGPPMDLVFALGSARVAARASQGKAYDGVLLPRNQCLDVIGTVQEWSRLASKNALIVPGYPGHGHLVRRVLSMALDANTCADLALEQPGGSRSPGFAMWESAEEYHAYALMLFNNGPLDSLAYDQARVFASAAGRLAEQAISDPGVLLPVLPEDLDVPTPKRVLIYARSMTGGSIGPRRSDAVEPAVPQEKTGSLAEAAAPRLRLPDRESWPKSAGSK